MKRAMTLILASASKTRADMLAAAGVRFEVEKPRVDEDAIKASLLAEGAKPRDIADTLAEYKARYVSGRRAGLVLGSDQVLVCESRLFSKPETMQDAADQLRQLRGKSHRLMSAAVIYEDAQPIWRHISTADLTMRDFSDAFIDTYLSDIGPAALWSVGCYQVEGRGVQLFSAINGDHFTILGLPLIQILTYLRTKGALLT